MTFRSEKLRRAVAELPCARCGREMETQAAHCNQGKGMALKASDATVFAACVSCHREIDTGGIPKQERRELEAALNLKTLRALVESGRLVVR